MAAIVCAAGSQRHRPGTFRPLFGGGSADRVAERARMADMVTLDELDRRLVHALQLDGRASFRRTATVLGVSERLLSRRYLRLRSQLALRVVGTTDPQRLGQLDWFLRLRTSAGDGGAVAAALAAREESSWVAVLAGGTEVTCILRAPAPAEGMTIPILAQLERHPRVQEVDAQCLLAPVAGVGGWPGRLGVLTPEERAALAPVRIETRKPVRLTAEDLALLRELARDARTTVARLGRATGLPETTVRRRIASLIDQGVLRFEIDIDPRLYGRPLEALCWLEIEPRGLDEATRALASHPQVAFAATTTGDHSVIAILELTDTQELHDYLTGRLSRLGGIRHAETALVEQRTKRAGMVLPGA